MAKDPKDKPADKAPKKEKKPKKPVDSDDSSDDESAAAPVDAAAVEEKRKAEQRRLQIAAWVRMTKAAVRGDALAKEKLKSIPKKLKAEVEAKLEKTTRKADRAKLAGGGGSATGKPDMDPCWICGERSASLLFVAVCMLSKRGGCCGVQPTCARTARRSLRRRTRT